MLNPLEEFVCDKCGQVIENPAEGYVEWMEKSGGEAEQFKMVHDELSTPFKDENGNCFFYSHKESQRMRRIKSFTGKEGLIFLISFIDNGLSMEKTPKYKFNVEFAELFRRLQIPFYEEARFYWRTAKKDGYFAKMDEINVYQSGNLKRLIDLYRY